MSDSRYYWLKLKRDFFKRHDIRIIESMQNGKDYILFYLKLLCESVDHDGNLRFSDEIPYNEEMLSTITDTNVDIVRSAITVFTQLGMMEVMDDGTYYMNEVTKMIGSVANNDNANRQRRFREKKKTQALLECDTSVTNSNESKSKSKSKSKSNNIVQPPVVKDDYKSEFEDLWSMYPKKRGNKTTAFNAYVKSRKEGVTKADVLIGINNYKAYIKVKNIEDQYILNGQTFFNGRRWNDDYSIRKQEQTQEHYNDKNQFNHFPQHEYDWDELERDLLGGE